MAFTYWINGNSAGPHLFNVGKLLLHTTEGSSIEGSLAAYRANNSWPHMTVDYRFGHPYRVCRHLDLDLAARALRNEPGGVQTNTAGVIQIEVVGAASRPDEIDWVTLGREVIGPLCADLVIPVVSTVPWVGYPASYGKGARQRLDGEAWIAYRGILGHQHVPENSHGDPGAIPIAAVLEAATPTTEDWFAMATREDLKAVLDEWAVDGKIDGGPKLVKEQVTWGHAHAYNADLYGADKPLVCAGDEDPNVWYAATLAGKFGPLTHEQAQALVDAELAVYHPSTVPTWRARMVPQWAIDGIEPVGAPPVDATLAVLTERDA